MFNNRLFSWPSPDGGSPSCGDDCPPPIRGNGRPSGMHQEIRQQVCRLRLMMMSVCPRSCLTRHNRVSHPRSLGNFANRTQRVVSLRIGPEVMLVNYGSASNSKPSNVATHAWPDSSTSFQISKTWSAGSSGTPTQLHIVYVAVVCLTSVSLSLSLLAAALTFCFSLSAFLPLLVCVVPMVTLCLLPPVLSHVSQPKRPSYAKPVVATRHVGKIKGLGTAFSRRRTRCMRSVRLQ